MNVKYSFKKYIDILIISTDKMKKIITDENKKGSFSGVVIGILLFLIFLVVLFELVLFIYAYTHAGEVECNLFWCTFKTTNTDIIQTIKCTLNNQSVNCSDINESILNKIYEEYLK